MARAYQQLCRAKQVWRGFYCACKGGRKFAYLLSPAHARYVKALTCSAVKLTDFASVAVQLVPPSILYSHVGVEEIRRRAQGTVIASELSTYTFSSAGENNPQKRYIPVKELSVYEVSSEATTHQGHAANIIDGNYNTRWHSDWGGTDRERYIIIELSKQFVLTGMDYIPAGGGNGKILNGKIYGS